MELTRDKKQLIYLVILLAVTVIFWNAILIYPIKLFVVMIHEMSHGLMAMLFGGDIIEIHIDRRIGGYCMYTMRPSFWGSLFWGSLILILAIKLEKDKYITLAIGVLLFILSYFVLQSGVWFGTFMTIGLGAFMLIAFRFFGPLFHDLWLKFIGIICCAYVILDIKGDLIDNSNIGSDADKIAELTGVPSVLVGITWLIIALITLFFVLRYIYKHTKTAN